jgi:hypothetical protein
MDVVPGAGRSSARAWPALTAIALVATVFTAAMAWPTREWSVMTDELQTWKIALGITEGDLLPAIHDVRLAARSVLYSYVLAPVVAVLDPVAAFRAMHALNALLMSLAALPAYALTLRVAQSRPAALVVAVATALSPWTVLSATVLSEVVAYPASALALWLSVRAIDEPGVRNDLLALVAIALAAAARTQLVLLAALLPVAVIGTELLWARRGPAAERRTLASALRSAATGHLVLAALCVVGAVGLAGAQLTGGVGRLLGTYSVTTEGDLFPEGTGRVAGELTNAVAVGIGVLPLLLAVAFALRALVRPRRRAELGLVVLAGAFVPLLMLQAASFTIRFVEGEYPQDRYVGYAAVPILAAAAAYLAGRRPGRELLPALAIAFWILSQSTFGTQPIIWASPAIAGQQGARELVATVTGWVGLEQLTFGEVLRLLVIGATLALVLMARRWQPSRALQLVAVPVLVAIMAQTAYAWIDVQRPFGERSRALDDANPMWIDDLAGKTPVALMPHAAIPSEGWWDAEFFNRRVDQAISIDGGPTYTPFSAAQLSIDPATGAITNSDPAPHELVLRADAEHRVGWRGEEVLGRSGGTRLVRLPQPYRADWYTTGAASDGSIEKRADLRVMAGEGAARRSVRLRFSLAPEARRAVRVRVGAGSTFLVRPGAERTAQQSVCVPAAGRGDLQIRASGAVPATGLPPLYVKLAGVAVGPPAGRCSGAQ